MQRSNKQGNITGVAAKPSQMQRGDISRSVARATITQYVVSRSVHPACLQCNEEQLHSINHNYRLAN